MERIHIYTFLVFAFLSQFLAGCFSKVELDSLGVPNALSLVEPATLSDYDQTPTVNVQGVLPENNVEIYDSETCEPGTLVGAKVSEGTEVNITTSVLAIGIHKLRAKSKTSDGSESTCISEGLDYEVLDSNLKLNLASSSAQLPKRYLNYTITGGQAPYSIVKNGKGAINNTAGNGRFLSPRSCEAGSTSLTVTDARGSTNSVMINYLGDAAACSDQLTVMLSSYVAGMGDSITYQIYGGNQDWQNYQIEYIAPSSNPMYELDWYPHQVLVDDAGDEFIQGSFVTPNAGCGFMGGLYSITVYDPTGQNQAIEEFYTAGHGACPPVDSDYDSIADNEDNCPFDSNPGQEDSNFNGIGEHCEDSDSDTVMNISDNCPMYSNPNQNDINNNGVGDACEDSDGDDFPEAVDNCPLLYNPTQTDSNENGIGDACENSDGDSFVDSLDNCPTISNEDQADSDDNGIGDVCEPD